MRRLFPAAALLIAGCATAPQPPPVLQTRPQPVLPQPPQASGGLLGMNSASLIQRFGAPALQIREGAGLKLQFRGACVLDAYLYPPLGVQGSERVTHIDARLRSGAPTDQSSCISALSAR